MNANDAYPYTAPPAPPKRKNNLVIILIAGLVVLVCCCLVAAALIVIADPFDLHLKDRLFGGTFDAAANAMPEDTGIYVGVNLLGATPDELNRIIQPFADALKIDQKSWDEILRELDKPLSQALDVTLSNDVKPWIGQYIGLGIYDIRMDEVNHPISLILAIESRDNGAADDFLKRLKAGIEKSNNASMVETEYKGVTLYTLPSENELGLAFCRSESLVLIGLEENDLHTAIDAQKGKSLVDNNTYHDMLDKMPGKRVATVFVSSQQIETLIQELQRQTGQVYDQINRELSGTSPIPKPEITQANLNTWDATLLGLSITGAGLQFDAVTSYNLDEMPAAQRELLESMGKSSQTIKMFPEDTLAFATSQRLDLAYDVAIEAMRNINQATSDSFDNALQSIRDETNIDLENDVLHRLDGEFTIGIFPSSQGILAKQANLDLGFALLAESSDTSALANTMDTLASKLEEKGTSVERSASGNLSLYEFFEQPGGDIMFASGIEKDYVTVASSSQAIEDLFAGKTSLAKSSRYRDAISPLPDGVTPVLYLDVEGILGILRESLPGYSDVNGVFLGILQPIPYIVMGESGIQNGISRTTFVIHVK